MTRFKFRLQKVLEYRERLEQEAKDAFLDARAKTLEAETVLAAIGRRRRESLLQPLDDLDSRQAMEMYLLRLDDEERQQTVVIEVLETEEESLRLAWVERRREHEAIVKLRDKAFAEWQLDASRKEQAALDEWAVLRSAA